MKRLIAAAFRPFWTLISLIVRPIVRKIDAKIQHMLTVAIQYELVPRLHVSLDASAQTLGRLEASLGAANRSAELLAADMDLVLSSVVREIARLQAQVDALQELVEHAVSPMRAGLTLVERDDEPVERSKVG